ncbi:MAG: flavodoxin domain-containing protein [Anaerolineales bacterium]|nr:flavodoxin domain-containing protein [Anaerolineales bacterium]
MTHSINRRSFLKTAGLGLGAAVVACGGLTALATQPPALDFYESTGDNAMTDKILIAYASKCGSTGEVAQAIADELTRRGQAVDVRLAGSVKTIAGYRAVLVGSAIRMGQWLPEAVKFVERNAAVLPSLPNAFFTVHMLNTGDDAASRQARAAYLAGVHQFMAAQSEVFFAGKLELAKMSFLDRLISQAMKAQDEDKRDWAAIRAWAQTVLA